MGMWYGSNVRLASVCKDFAVTTLQMFVVPSVNVVSTKAPLGENAADATKRGIKDRSCGTTVRNEMT